MQTLKTITIDAIGLSEYRVEIRDAFTDAEICSVIASENEQQKKLAGFMNWYVRIFCGENLVYEENPFILAPPKREPKMRIPSCLVGITKREGKVTVYQMWAARSLLGKREKRHYPGTVVIRMGGLGDLIALTSGLSAYKERNPREDLTLATLPHFVGLFEKAPFLDNCIPITDLEYARFDKVIDLRWAVEPAGTGGGQAKALLCDYTSKDRSDMFDELLGVYPAQKRFWIPVERIDHISLLFAGKPLAALNAAMVAPARMIIPAYIEPLCEKLVAAGYCVALFGQSQAWTEQLKEISGQGIINLIDKTSQEEMIALCARADLVITPDTGTLHIAGALGKRTIALFGNINPRTRASYYPSVRSLYPHGAYPCIPCWDITHHCVNDPADGSRCMRLLNPDVIMRAVTESGPTKAPYFYVDKEETAKDE